MNWTKVLIAGIAGGVVAWIADFIMHGAILGNTYAGLPEVFTQEQANPLHFLLISVCTAIAAAILFAKTRSAWGAGIMGGLTFGFLLGLVVFFTPFYSSLVLEGYPYYLSWCQGGAALISATILGAILGLVYKQA